MKADLDRYAALQVRIDGEPVDTMTLISHMPEAFSAREESGEARGEGSRGHLMLDDTTGDWGCLNKLSLS
ncbi:hypothetical protein [Thiocapsa rosea]|uniref:hypothetical protein n=1 Tax=Thiocapsa rosea TaxID=69360 RepID=UPI001B887369